MSGCDRRAPVGSSGGAPLAEAGGGEPRCEPQGAVAAPGGGVPGGHYNTVAMARVVVLGAGELGGALAHKLAARDRVGSVCLVDSARGVAAGKALDIRQSGPIERFGTRLAAGTVDAVVGAGVVVVADPVRPRGEAGRSDPGSALVERVAALAGDAPIVCAGAAGGELIARAVRELSIARCRIMGSAPEALAAGLRALIALEADVSPGQVAVQVLGRPPEHPVVAWSTASVAGGRLEDRLSPSALARVRRRVERLWPPGPYVLASAAARVVEALAAGGSRRVFTCFVGDGSRRSASAPCVPVTLGAGGVDGVLAPVLSPSERVRLDNALEAAS